MNIPTIDVMLMARLPKSIALRSAVDNMGDLAIKQAQPEQARLYYEKSLRIFNKNKEADENSTRVLTKLASLGERKVY